MAFLHRLTVVVGAALLSALCLLGSFLSLVSASPSGGVVALLTLFFDFSAPCVPDASRPLCAVERSPSPGAPFAPPAALSSSLLPSALDRIWLFFAILPLSLVPCFFWPFASLVAFFLLVSALPSGGVVALSTSFFDFSAPWVPYASRPLCAVERSPSPGAPFAPPAALSSLSLPSALDCLWLFFAMLPLSLALRFFRPFASLVID
jgi:hypothetical protein